MIETFYQVPRGMAQIFILSFKITFISENTFFFLLSIL